MAKRLRYNIGWALFGNSVFAAVQWAIIILIARIGSPEMDGSYALALAIAAPVFMLANLNLRAFQATDIQGAFQFGEYLSVRLLTSVVAMCVVAGLCLLGIVPAAHVMVVLAVSAAKAFETLSDAFYGLFQRHEELDLVARSLVLRGCLGFIGMAGGLAIGGSLEAGATGMAAAWLLVIAVVDVPGSRRFAGWPGLRLGRSTIDLIRRAAPLGLVMMMLAISQSIPTYVIEYALGTEQLGFYASVAYFLVAGRIVSNAVSQSSSPRLARFLVQRNAPAFRRLLHMNLLLGLTLGVAGVLVSILLGEQLLGLVYGQAYARYGLLLTCTMAAAGLGFMAAFLGAALTAARRFGAMVTMNLLSLVATGLLCWWAIPLFGLLGAPLAVGMAFLLKVTVNMVVVEQFLRTWCPEPCAGAEHA
jgi:O-antigen/teichoic acid export membrane protein